MSRTLWRRGCPSRLRKSTSRGSSPWQRRSQIHSSARMCASVSSSEEKLLVTRRVRCSGVRAAAASNSRPLAQASKAASSSMSSTSMARTPERLRNGALPYNDADMSRARALAQNASLACGAVAVVLLLAEGTLRAVGFRPERHLTRIRLTNAADLDVRANALVLDCYPSDPGRSFDVDLADLAVRRRYEAAGVRGLERASAFPHALEFRYNSRGFRAPEFP